VFGEDSLTPSIDPTWYDRVCLDRASFISGTTINWALVERGAIVEGSSGATTQPVFAIASVTKVFTATLLALAVQRGLVRLDCSIGAILGSKCALLPETAEITLLQLATHTSGLPRLPTNLRTISGDPYADYSVDLLYECLSSIQPGSVVDGRGVYEYSNLGAGLVGHLLALIFSDALENVFEREIFQPLGMRSSSVIRREMMDRCAHTMVGFDADGNAAAPWHFDVLAGAGGVISNAADLGTFIRSCFRGEAEIAYAARCAMQKGPTRGPLFWMPSTSSVLWHNGETYGAHAMIAVELERQLAAIALWNAAYTLDDIPLAALGVLEAPEVLPVESPPIPPEVLMSYAGIYAGYLGRFTVTISGSRLRMEGRRYPSQLLYPGLQEHSFFSKRRPGTLIFEADENGAIVAAAECPRNWPARRAPKMSNQS
jgi:CubicO group peptidase (beta-lactamase class C family)